jgi:para-nitrobenzyl esterase
MFKSILSGTAAVGAGVLLASAALAAPAPVRTQSGMLQGAQGDGVVVYKGIPYAAPPVGDLRWRPPQPPASWPGVRAADRFGDSCMQNPPPVGGPLTVSEDCLYLNVWTPSPAPAGKLPVMVWIHGGGFQIGSSAWPQTDGTSLAHHGVVLVSLNYRMGKFGFFAHPALTKEANGGELGDYGIMDMIAALKWVKANIAAFGGDPGNVTIFGESAGGMAVDFLMISPDARGLFEKAIVESGAGRSEFRSLANAEADGAAAAEAWGVKGDDPAALRAVPARTVLGDASISSGGSTPFIDGKVVPEDPLKAFEENHLAHVPFMIGTNSYEIGVFPGMAPTLVKAAGSNWPAAQAAYDGYGTHDPKLVQDEFATDAFMTEPARALALAAAKDGLPVWRYRFSYLRPSQRDGKIPGPLHFDEVYLVFDTMKTSPPPISDDKAAVEAVESRWTSFARSGVPGADWPRFEAGDEAQLDFTNDGPVARKDFHKTQLDLVEHIAESKTSGP